MNYVRNKKNPDFNEFVNSSLENIMAVSNGFQGKSPNLLSAWWKIVYNEQKWGEVKNAITALAQTCLRYQTEGLKALADSASSSRSILTLTNALADESSNASINNATSRSPTYDTANPLVDDTGRQRRLSFPWC